MEEKKEEVRSQGHGRRRKKEINRRAEEEKLGAQILNKNEKEKNDKEKNENHTIRKERCSIF